MTDIALTDAKTHSIDDAARPTSLEPLQTRGIGDTQARQVLDATYKQLTGRRGVYLHPPTVISTGEDKITIYRVNTALIPQPINRQLQQLKNSDIDVILDNNIPGLEQFVGSLDGQYLYLLEHPKHVLLAHMNKIIAHKKKS